MTKSSKPFDTVKQDLDEAVAAFEQAKNKADIARSEETAATNRLNAKQKAFDEAVAEVRQTAPYGSDWYFNGKQRGEAL